jgi:hypothetical protein
VDKVKLSVLNAFNPLVAASILLYRERGLDEVKALLKRSVDFGKIKEKVWYGPIFGLLPLTYILAFGGMTFSGKTLPESQVPLLLAPVFLAVFFVLAVGEEVGWMGYAFDPLRRRWNALTTL